MNIGHFGYLLWLLLFIGIPTTILWIVNGRYLFRYRKVYLYCLVCSILFGFPWDTWAIRTHMWHYGSGHILGIWVLGQPLEECLFLLTAPILFTSIALAARKHVMKAEP